MPVKMEKFVRFTPKDRPKHRPADHYDPGNFTDNWNGSRRLDVKGDPETTLHGWATEPAAVIWEFGWTSRGMMLDIHTSFESYDGAPPWTAIEKERVKLAFEDAGFDLGHKTASARKQLTRNEERAGSDYRVWMWRLIGTPEQEKAWLGAKPTDPPLISSEIVGPVYGIYAVVKHHINVPYPDRVHLSGWMRYDGLVSKERVLRDLRVSDVGMAHIVGKFSEPGMIEKFAILEGTIAGPFGLGSDPERREKRGKLNWDAIRDRVEAGASALDISREFGTLPGNRVVLHMCEVCGGPPAKKAKT
jgi:hypothetical protein